MSILINCFEQKVKEFAKGSIGREHLHMSKILNHTEGRHLCLRQRIDHKHQGLPL